MSKIWKLYKGRLILCLVLALLGGFSLVAWLLTVNSPRATLGHVLLTALIRGPLAAAVLFLVLAGIVVPKNAGRRRPAFDDDSHLSDVISGRSGPDLRIDDTAGIAPWSSSSDDI